MVSFASAISAPACAAEKIAEVLPFMTFKYAASEASILFSIQLEVFRLLK